MERIEYKSGTTENDYMHIDRSLVNRDLEAADVIRKQLTNQSGISWRNLEAADEPIKNQYWRNNSETGIQEALIAKTC